MLPAALTRNGRWFPGTGLSVRRLDDQNREYDLESQLAITYSGLSGHVIRRWNPLAAESNNAADRCKDPYIDKDGMMMVSQSLDTWSSAMTAQTKQPGHQSSARKFFVMTPDVRGGGKGHGVRMVNEDALKYPGLVVFGKPVLQPPGFKYFTGKPLLIYDKREGRLPRDLESYSGYWLVSERMRQVLENVDAEGFAFVECGYTLADGSAGPQYYLCDIVRTLDALDEHASKVRIHIDKDFDTGEEFKIYGILSTTKLVFREEVVGAAHIFRQERLAIDTICDEALRTACKAAGLTGIQFRDFNS